MIVILIFLLLLQKNMVQQVQKKKLFYLVKIRDYWYKHLYVLENDEFTL